MALNSKDEYEQELEELKTNPSLYMTPGAKKYFRRVAVGYVVLACAAAIGIWGVSNHTNNELRENINTYLIESCKSGIPIIKKFNQSLQADIDLQEDARVINIQRGDSQRASLNKKIIDDKKDSMIPVPSIEECENRKTF